MSDLSPEDRETLRRTSETIGAAFGMALGGPAPAVRTSIAPQVPGHATEARWWAGGYRWHCECGAKAQRQVASQSTAVRRGWAHAVRAGST